jgi:hypothetical protein
MTMLTEPQIQRYARQILLREVGGRGQERLLEAKVQLIGNDAALAVAAAYLAAGGTALDCESQEALGGFLFGTTLADFCPDSLADVPSRVRVASAPEWLAGVEPADHGMAGEVVNPGDVDIEVVIGGGGVAFRSGPICETCFEAAVKSVNSPETPDVGSVLLGTLAALCVQKSILDAAATSGVLQVGAFARIRSIPLKCELHL